MIPRYLDTAIFFILIVLTTLGLVLLNSTLYFGGLILIALTLPYYIHKYPVFSKTSSLVAIFVLGMVIAASSITTLFHTKDMKLGMMAMYAIPFTLIVFPDIFATSLIAREKRKNMIFAFYFWFLLSVIASGILVLFALLPTGHPPSSLFLPGVPFAGLVRFLVLYTGLTAVASAFSLLYKHAQIFLVLIPLPLFLGFVMYVSM